MEIKIKEKNAAITKITKSNSTTSIKTINTSFSKIYNNVVNNSKSADTNITEINPLKDYEDHTDKKITTGNVLIDNLPPKNKADVLKAINDINGIFSIDILGNPDKFINKDSTINITRILDIYGSNIKSSDLDDLSKSINTLMDNGLISNEDYFTALKWIATKQEAFRIKMQSEKNRESIGSLICTNKKS